MANKTLKIKAYLSEVKDEILNEIKSHKRLLLSSNPATGKTSLFSEIILENKDMNHFKRIVFCAPFVIIQRQFKEKLNENNLDINLELNFESKRKKIKEEDKIITSTFKSFHYISNKLTSKDLVIVDEAHSLLMMFPKQNLGRTDYDFFSKFYSNLFQTKAKVVLMTGTPTSSLNQLFKNLKSVIVQSNCVKAKINIFNSSKDKESIIKQFVNECIGTSGPTSLNTIYIKSIKDCYIIKEYIKKLGYSSEVLTSQNKDQQTYKTLVSKSLIPYNIQFLITTNVISTGTNILNNNIGKALMLNEYDPIEIKQFSKRFRNKLNIEIDLVNKFNSKKKDLIGDRDKIKKLRIKQREYVNTHIKNLILINKNHEVIYNDFNEFGGLGSILNPEIYLKNILDRNLLQEIFYSKELTETYKSEKELYKALSIHDDLLPLEINSTYVNDNFSENITNKEYKSFIESEFIKFLKNPINNLREFHKYLREFHKYSDENKKLELLLRKINQYENSDSVRIKKSNNIIIYKEIITPFLQVFWLFENNKDTILNIQKCLYFLMNNKRNKRKRFLVSLWFNHQFQNFFSIIKNEFNENILQEKDNSKANLRLIKFLIEKSFFYSIKNDLIYYNDFEKLILNCNHNKGFENNNSFFWRNSLNIQNGKIVEISRDFGLGLLHSVIGFNKKALTRKHPEIKTKNRVNSYSPINIQYIESQDYPNVKIKDEILNSLKTLEINLTHKFGKGFDLNTKQRVLISKEYLVNSILNKKFFELIE